MRTLTDSPRPQPSDVLDAGTTVNLATGKVT